MMLQNPGVIVPATYCHALGDGRLQCVLCPRACWLPAFLAAAQV
jgi:hypothetical protein